MKIKSILITILILISPACHASTQQDDIKMLENDITYGVWTTRHVLYTFPYENGVVERDILTVGCEFISTLPQALKTIIARYSTFIPFYMWDAESLFCFVHALGDFSTLEEAQDTLLKDWDPNRVILRSDYPATLYIRKTEKSFFFEYQSLWNWNKTIDEFQVGEDGQITYIVQPDPI